MLGLQNAAKPPSRSKLYSSSNGPPSGTARYSVAVLRVELPKVPVLRALRSSRLGTGERKDGERMRNDGDGASGAALSRETQGELSRCVTLYLAIIILTNSS